METSSIEKLFQELYNNFNDREIELVISKMTDDVKWANGMDGGKFSITHGVWVHQIDLKIWC